MKYLVIFLVLIGLTITLSANNIYAMPSVDSQTIYDYSKVILLGKVISVNSTFSPTHNLYEIKVEKFLKNKQDSEMVFVAGQKTVNLRAGNSVFSVNDRALFFLNNNTMGYDRYSGIFGLFSNSQLVKPEWDKCNIFEKEIPREHWFLGGVGIAPKIQQGTNDDIENFKKDELITVTYDVSNLSEHVQEFDLDSTISVSNGTTFEVRAITNQHIILEPCTAYKTIDWRVIPNIIGSYNFEIKDSRSGNYGLGFTVVDNSSVLTNSPLKQVKSGIEPKDVVCKPGLELVMKKSNEQPICIKGTSVKNLTLRGYIHEYNGMDGEIPSDEIVIGIPHALPVEPKQSETPESLLAQFEILANENLILQDQRILKMQEIDDARANKSNSISTLEAELDVINEKLKQSGIKLDQIRTATSKFYEIDSQLKATLEKAQQILTDNHDIIPWNGLGIDPKSKTLLIEFESSDLADKYAPVIRELIGEDIPITIFVGKNTFD